MIAATTVTPSDHHTEYLARAVASLTPEGHRRVDELVDQLAASAGDRGRLVRFAADRRSEADLGGAGISPEAEPEPPLTRQELEALAAGFMTIRDQEPLDDVGDWANAVLALLRDEAARTTDPDARA